MNLTDIITAITSDTATDDRIAAAATHIRDGQLDPAEVEQAATARFEEIHGQGGYDADTTTQLEQLADIADAARQVRAEQQQAAQEQAQRDEQVSALAERVRNAGTDEATPDTADTDPAAPAVSETSPAGDSADTTGEQGEQPPAQEPAGDTAPETPEQTASGDDGGATPTPAPEPSGGATVEQMQQTPELVPASASATPAPAQRPSTTQALNAARNTVPNTAAPQQTTTSPARSFSITASAEVPDVPHGKNLTMAELADASASRFATFPVGDPTAGTLRANVARINRHYEPQRQLTGDRDDVGKIDQTADETRLPGGSLVAATQQAITAAAQAPSTIQDVWCTPSETDYTLCPPLATTAGMLDLPTTGMPARGGIRYPVWKQYPEQDGWHGQVIEYPQPNPNCSPNPENPTGGLADPGYFRQQANHKKCIEGPCVEWCEVRASLSYLCITSDILRDTTFPEGLQRFMSDVLIQHQHYLNATYIQHLVANADPIPAFSVQDGAGQIGSSSLTVVDRLALLVTWFRDTYRMAEGSTLEIVAPEWFREYLKRDLEKKQNRPFGTVTNAEIAALFAQYASRVQWVRDWQDMPNGTAVGGRVMPPNDWPGSVNILAYPAGSWVLSEGNVLTLGVQYDHQLLMENRYSASFVEDMWMLLNRCNRTFLLQLTDLCANGAVGPERDACPPDTTPATAITVAADPTTPAPGGTSTLSAKTDKGKDVTQSTTFTVDPAVTGASITGSNTLSIADSVADGTTVTVKGTYQDLPAATTTVTVTAPAVQNADADTATGGGTAKSSKK